MEVLGLHSLSIPRIYCPRNLVGMSADRLSLSGTAGEMARAMELTERAAFFRA